MIICLFRKSFENTAAKMIKLRQSLQQQSEDRTLDSFSNTVYQAPSHLKEIIVQRYADDFFDSFRSYAKEMRGEFYVHVNNIERVVTNVLGPDTPQWILSKFDKLSRQHSDYGFVVWEDFRFESL